MLNSTQYLICMGLRPSPPLDNISAMMICLEVKRENYQNCSVLYCVYNTAVHDHMHTDVSSSYR